MVSSRPLDWADDAVSVPELLHGVVLDNGSEPVHEFLEKLTDSHLAEFYAKFTKLRDSVLKQRPVWHQMGQWFKPLKNVSNVWEVAAASYRILGFREGDVLIFTNGFEKKRGDTPRAEIKRSTQLQAAFKAARSPSP
ncbi:MAG: type II toxin-antitoxin system RelE/ParE family toxin [Myxococcales bacterium]